MPAEKREECCFKDDCYVKKGVIKEMIEIKKNDGDEYHCCR